MILIDALNVARIYFIQIKNWFLWFFLYTLLFPIGLIFFLRVASNNIDSVRLAAGATVLSISTIAVNATGYWVITDRFQYRIQLIKSLPISFASYYMAIIIVSVSQSLINIYILVFVLKAFDFAIRISPLLSLAVFTTTIFFSLFGIFIGRIVKDTSHGTLMMNLFSTGAVLMCPIFYPIEALPLGIARIAALMPHTIAFRVFCCLYN